MSKPRLLAGGPPLFKRLSKRRVSSTRRRFNAALSPAHHVKKAASFREPRDRAITLRAGPAPACGAIVPTRRDRAARSTRVSGTAAWVRQRRLHGEDGYTAQDIEQITRALAEAYDWLITHGLLSGIPGKDAWLFITRKGLRVLEAKQDGVPLLKAEARLDVELHALMGQRVRAQFLLGEYEMAAMLALRQVEIRVRELSGSAPGDIGVALMKRAFSETGPLRDSASEKGEQDAMMALFWCAIGVFKNPVSHRQVDYDDPTLASEVILLADLLRES